MKKIIWIIVLVLIVLLIVSINKKPTKNTDVIENREEKSTSTSTIKTQGLNIPDGIYSIKTTDAKITWTGRKVILKNWIDTGKIDLKEASFEMKSGSIISNKFVIDMSTIAASSTGAGGGQDKLSTHLKSADFFDVEKFPTSTFIAKEFTQIIDQNTEKLLPTKKVFVVKGDLTIKSVTNEISIPVTFDITDPKNISIVGSVDLDRTLWDVRYGSTKFFKSLGDNVIDDMFNLSFELKVNTK